MIALIKSTSLRLSWAIIILVLIVSCNSHTQRSKVVWLDELDIPSFEEGIRMTKINKNYRGEELQIAGQNFERGIGTHSTSIIFIDIHSNTKQFSALLGTDDIGDESSSVEFYVIGDKKILYESGLSGGKKTG